MQILNVIGFKYCNIGATSTHLYLIVYTIWRFHFENIMFIIYIYIIHTTLLFEKKCENFNISTNNTINVKVVKLLYETRQGL